MGFAFSAGGFWEWGGGGEQLEQSCGSGVLCLFLRGSLNAGYTDCPHPHPQGQGERRAYMG